MALSTRIRKHLQGNAVAYAALFVALGGTALALPGHKQVKSDDLANGAVKSKAIATAAVSEKKLKSGAVTETKLGAGAVTAAKLRAGAVGVSQLADDAVERKKLKAQAVTSQKLADSAVTSDKVADGTLLATDFGPGQISDGFLATGGGSFAIARSGRVYTTATLVPACTAGTCTFTVQIDGASVPGATATVDNTPPEQLTLIGLTGAVAAGNHTVSLLSSGTGAAATQVQLGGILLQ